MSGIMECDGIYIDLFLRGLEVLKYQAHSFAGTYLESKLTLGWLSVNLRQSITSINDEIGSSCVA